MLNKNKMKNNKYVLAVCTILLSSLYASANCLNEFCMFSASPKCVNAQPPKFDGHRYIKEIRVYFDNGGKKDFYTAWLYKSISDNSYCVATDCYSARRLEEFVYQNWMPVWAKQYKYTLANGVGYCNI